ncbi:hypothetical protein NG791_22580 [Laspinema sp. D1]|uniref:hypothetical protein n=1 Tax=Laspinema palackyanum TaxID=3231601 RepID=UPI00347A4A55|nr:hypothetical protein [Laspinema sp. D2b]
MAGQIPQAQLHQTKSKSFEEWNALSQNQRLPDSKAKALSAQYDRLLYWLSATGIGNRESFKKTCEALELEEPKRILRRLRLLGHIESSPDGKRWSVAPTALVKVDSDLDPPQFILCGQRSIDLLGHLKKYAQLKYIYQPGSAGPHCIRLQMSEPNLITNHSGFTVVNVGEASLRLAKLLPDIKIWQEQLTSLPGIVPSLYQWQQFNCQTNKLEECSHPGETGLYELCRETNPNYRYTLFYDRERDAWLQGDWYGLRFIALHYSAQQCLACYNRDTNRLAIPWNQRWPEIYERALLLASGFLPTDYKTQQSRWLIYENIGKELVQKLVEKLHLTCQED